MGRAIVAVFAKPPRSGRSKTRLAAGVGPAQAAALAQAFLADTWAMCGGVSGLSRVLATTEPGAHHGLPEDAVHWDQGKGDLGTRLERVLARALAEADLAIALGADSPGLPPERLIEACRALDGADAVIGPARDGGYYLLGLRRCAPGLFDGLPWSTVDTCRATTERLRARGFEIADLEPWFDIDSAADLRHFRDRVARSAAPRTWDVLDTIGTV